jgi:protein-S-isoprenylcysteine O-methyltransferase Ste14
MHKFIVWLCAVFEICYYLALVSPFKHAPLPITTIICPLSPPSALHTTPLCVIGVLAVFLGTYIITDSFHALGEFFTVDLAVHPQHKLVTSRFYAHVRHPSYTGAILIVLGLTFSHLSRGSWLTTCGALRIPGVAVLVWALWWVWVLCVVAGRAEAEDEMMMKLFDEQWEQYAAQVPWKIFPGVI